MSTPVMTSSTKEFRSAANMSLGLRRLLIMCAAALMAVLPVALVASQPAGAAAAKNANFVGNWKVSGGYLGFIIKSENLRTGVCKGLTPSAAYHMINCRVSGHKYAFTITYGSGYRSNNTGTFSGNRAVGQFSDSNGTFVHYTAVR